MKSDNLICMVEPIVLSVTEAARSFAECISRVRYQGASYLLLKGGTPVAKIVPVEAEPAQPEKVRLSAREFAEWRARKKGEVQMAKGHSESCALLW